MSAPFLFINSLFGQRTQTQKSHFLPNQTTLSYFKLLHPPDFIFFTAHTAVDNRIQLKYFLFKLFHHFFNNY